MASPLELALAEAADRFRRKHPKAAALHERACEVLPGGNTRSVLYTAPFPIRVERGEGARLFDVDGHEYVDFVGEYSAGIYGHSHPRIRQAVEEALRGGVNIGAHHAREVAFAEAVTRRFGLDLVRFTNSGTEANMLALAAARAFTGRSKILVMKGAYHGGTLSFGDGPGPVNAPYDCVMAELNDVEGTRRLISADLAAVIIEPMMGGAGCLAADRAFLQMLREECSSHGVVLIHDEVMTSRLHPGGLSAHFGVAPDLETLGKYVGGGMSFGAFGGRREIMRRFDPSRPDALPHAGTFNNNTLTMTAGVVGLTEVFTPAACVELNERGDRLRQALNGAFAERQVPMQAAGMGSLMTVHPLKGRLSSPADAQKGDKRLKGLLFLDLLDQGLFIAERGLIALSLAVTDEDCARLVAAVRRFVETRHALLMQ
ncbi:MAG TPA: aminotransferase class III-fold pyridoxal phosphate-dependent enzyme [Myxococcaceae bacterium]|nr:aminotransferase class III-fold pyridoxal phosphate-dependent enzyme [Myxococcaceae bacterium]